MAYMQPQENLFGGMPSSVNQMQRFGQGQQQGYRQPQGDFFGGTPSSIEQIQRFGPEQSQGFMQALQQAMAQLQNPTAGFEPIAADARRNFQEETVPGIAERFAGMDATRSSAFTNALGSAGAGLESQLSAQKAQYGQNQQGISQNLLGLGLTPQYESFYHKEQPGFLQQLFDPEMIKAFAKFLPLFI